MQREPEDKRGEKGGGRKREEKKGGQEEKKGGDRKRPKVETPPAAPAAPAAPVVYVCKLCETEAPVLDAGAHHCPVCTLIACTSECKQGPHPYVSCGRKKIEDALVLAQEFPQQTCFNCNQGFMIEGPGKEITCPNCRKVSCWVHRVEINRYTNPHFCGYSSVTNYPGYVMSCRTPECKHDATEGSCLINFPSEEEALAYSARPSTRRLHVYNFRLILMAARHHVDKGVSSIYDIIHLDEYQRMIFAFLR